jgi:hypothetical protein
MRQINILQSASTLRSENCKGRQTMIKERHFILLAIVAYIAWFCFHNPAPTTISVRIGQSFEEVASSSSYPVVASSNIPTYDEAGIGVTWVKKPAVIIQFNDPQHKFTLPPTKFAAIGYRHNKVDTIATSPMLRKLSFAQAATELALLQSQFQAGGWQLENGTTWFNLTPEGRKELHEYMRHKNNGFMKTALLVIPKKYAITFRIWCAARCDSTIGLDRYLIDIGVGEDIGFEIKQRKRQREEGLTR